MVRSVKIIKSTGSITTTEENICVAMCNMDVNACFGYFYA